MAKYYYNVFNKDGELVMEKVTSKEICNQLGFRKQNLTEYIRRQLKYKGSYTFQRYGDEEPDEIMSRAIELMKGGGVNGN